MTRPHPPAHRPAPRAAALLAAALSAVVVGCADGTGPDGVRFGQIGRVDVVLESPRIVDASAGPVGMLVQSIEWRSSGAWRMSESISYRGRTGDRHDTASVGDPARWVQEYATWITLVNDPTQGIQLVGYEPLDPELDPNCGPYNTRVTVSITDEVSSERRSWTRCAETPLDDLDPRGAGPDAPAGRVVQAAQMVRDRTIGATRPFRSAYVGSYPFATLLRGGDLQDVDAVPDGGVIRDAETWTAFWGGIAAGATPPLEVDFEEEVVLVAHADRMRGEAGDSVEVRRVVPVELGTRVEFVEREPGDFCSPADTDPYIPFHVVVSPTVPEPVRISRVRVERVPCLR